MMPPSRDSGDGRFFDIHYREYHCIRSPDAGALRVELLVRGNPTTNRISCGNRVLRTDGHCVGRWTQHLPDWLLPSNVRSLFFL